MKEDVMGRLRSTNCDEKCIQNIGW